MRKALFLVTTTNNGGGELPADRFQVSVRFGPKMVERAAKKAQRLADHGEFPMAVQLLGFYED